MPRNIVIDSVPISSNVVAAFLLLGRRNAGTPLLIASTPVNAVQPDANARSARNTSARPATSVCSGITSYPALSATGADPASVRARPTTIIVRMPARNRYVGTANARPDSLTPRRFAAVSSATNPTAIGTRLSFRSGNAEMTASVPAETDTATVSA